MNQYKLLELVEGLAADVGRLRRRFASNGDAWSGSYVADRVAGHVETLDAWFHASAAEIYRDDVFGGATEEEAVQHALAVVDKRARTIRGLLGESAR